MKRLAISLLLFGAALLHAQSAGSSSAAANVGQTATFTVTNDGTAPFTYQWQKNGAAIPGATSASLVITPVATTDAGTYTVVVSNAAGSTTSTPASLSVIAKPTTATASVSVK